MAGSVMYVIHYDHSLSCITVYCALSPSVLVVSFVTCDNQMVVD